jgi:SAM-dependent methyltransferase
MLRLTEAFVVEQVECAIAGVASTGSTTRILHAGCGSIPAAFAVPALAHVAGIDTSAAQLARNETLDEKVLGDIRTHRFDQQFDIVSSWDVLEHVPDPVVALASLVQATRSGGLLVLKVPNVLSVKGLVTKLTPYPLHVWVYRRLYGYDHAGRDDHGPFRTFLRLTISEPGLRRFARRHALTVEFVARYESEHQVRLRRRLRLDGAPWRGLCALVRVASLGLVSLDATELVVLMRK